MSWLGGSEVGAGLTVLVLATLLTLVLRRRGRRTDAPIPSHLFMALVPVTLEIAYVLGVMLMLHGMGLV